MWTRQDGSMTERLLLLDTASLYYRAFYGMPDTMRAPDGTPVNAVRGMLDFVARLVQDHEPTRLVACMDADWRPHGVWNSFLPTRRIALNVPWESLPETAIYFSWWITAWIVAFFTPLLAV